MNHRIAFISASWHKEIVDVCHSSFLQELKAIAPSVEVEDFTVPGSLEMPHLSKMLAQTGRFSAVACAGFVVDGGIYRHDFVAKAVIDGIVQVSLTTGVPVMSAILTPHHFHEHDVHQEFFRSHMVTKGKELANACVHTLGNIDKVKALSK